MGCVLSERKRRHWVLREVDGNRDRSTSGSLVSVTVTASWLETELWLGNNVVRGSWANDVWRNWSGSSHVGVLKDVDRLWNWWWRHQGWLWLLLMSVDKGIKGGQLCKLSRQGLCLSTKDMSQVLRGLLIGSEISSWVEPARVGRIHEEVRWMIEMNYNLTLLLSWVLLAIGGIDGLQFDAADIREWVLNLVTSRVVVDVVGDALLLWRVEDNQIHAILTNTSPRANAERTAVEVVNENFLARVWFRREGSVSTESMAQNTKGLSLFRSLSGKILSHRLWDVAAVLAVLDALFSDKLDLSTTVLEPNLHRALSHVDLLGDSLANVGIWGRVLVELCFQSDELVLGGSLTLLILLLLGKSALSWRTSACTSGLGGGGRSGGRSEVRHVVADM